MKKDKDTSNDQVEELDVFQALSKELAPVTSAIKYKENFSFDEVMAMFKAIDWTFGLDVEKPGLRGELLDIFVPEVIGLDYDREEFLSLLLWSYSLSKAEKRRVIRALSTGLSQFQITELRKTFLDERDEFTKLVSTEVETIFGLHLRVLWNACALLFGDGLANLTLRSILVSELDGKPTNVLPLFFDRSTSYFWLGLIDYALRWSADNTLMSRLIDKGIQARAVTRNIDYKIAEHEFLKKICETIYRVETRSYSRERSYIGRRVAVMQELIIPLLESHEQPIETAALWVNYVVRDEKAIGDVKKARTVLKKAELLFNSQEMSERQNNKYWHRFCHDQVYLNSDLDKPIEASQKIMMDMPDSAFYTQFIACNFMLNGNGQVAIDILGRMLLDANKNQHDARDEAVDLITYSLAIGNKAAQNVASQYLANCLFNAFKKQVTSKKRDLDIACTIYCEFLVLKWLGSELDEVALNDLEVIWEDVCGEDFHAAMASTKSTHSRWAYTLCHNLERALKDKQFNYEELINQFRSTDQLLNAIFVVYALSNNSALRKICRKVANSLYGIRERRILGIPVDMRLFKEFVEDNSNSIYAGCSETEIAKWKGNFKLRDFRSDNKPVLQIR